MTYGEAVQNKPSLACFYCFANLDRYPNILVVCTMAGVVEIKNSRQQVAPMVFCSSDCMYFESHLRYQSRIVDGTFRKVEPRDLKLDEVPNNWKSDNPILKSDS